MSLKQKLIRHNWVVVFGLLVVGLASLWGLEGLRRQVAVTLGAYADLAGLQQAAQQASAARKQLSAAAPDRASADEMLRRSMDGVRQFIAHEQSNYYMNSASAMLSDLTTAASQRDPKVAVSWIDRAQDDFSRAAVVCQTFIQNNDHAASRRLRYTMLAIAAAFAATLIAAALSSMRQYRNVMVPLRRLGQGVRELAAADFGGQLPESGDAEFVELAAEFNRMAGQLDTFYRKLEEQVVLKSRELVRSERLASVGYLAAGVAHEINNPLNIISGFAELSLRRLSSREDPPAIEDTRQALRMVRDEAFRCKEITAKLLSLAKGGSEVRQTLALDHVAREVALMTRGLKDFTDCNIELKFDGPLNVRANETEMKQVLLNLTVNALQAVDPSDGRVWIEGRQNQGWVELTVRDNGSGIPPEAIDQVFEPFYTRKKGGLRAPGTGLGLSITHAIIENHGGRIRAESAGAGMGSRFTVELPAAGTAS